MEQGPVERTIIEQSFRFGTPLPEKFQNAPVITRGLEFYYMAFMDLSTCRSVGFAEGPIPWNAIHWYAEAYNIDGDDYHYFFALIRAVDAGYLEYQEKRRKQKETA